MNPFIHRTENYWFQRRAFLETAGYRLRPKFQPDFVATKSSPPSGIRHEYTSTHPKPQIMDAERVSDGKHIILKSVSNKTHPFEVELGMLFSCPPLSEDPRNHCIPILEVLQDPEDNDKQIIVMPRLMRFYHPIFDTVGEVIDCFRQVFEGIQFMHENHVAHRDCGLLNIVVDPSELFPHGFHPVNFWRDTDNYNMAHTIPRTQCWPRYYIIDFGLSRRYNPESGPPLEDVVLGGDKSPPEHREDRCNPFPTDVYFLGNLLKKEFIHSDALKLSGDGNHKPLHFLRRWSTK
ncbi:hypothetical protein C8R46DRAFT_1074931 [Mycena filopes]|nr:hypothetical protein C8R46DRAFT_1074931 [Mycena filopes]